MDLHAHSTASDGALAPERVVAAASAAGLGALALTDHDTVNGVAEAQAAAGRAGIRLVAGCELSAYDGEREIHLLALHISDAVAIAAELERFRLERIERARQMVAKLNALGVPITMPDVLREAAGGAVGRPHVARTLINGGYVADNREAFDRYLATGKPGYVAKPRITVAAAIALAHRAGALAIWAHPGREGNLERAGNLAAQGLDGIEVRHPSHTAADVNRLARIVAQLQLVPSGGSDWHGAPDAYRALGNMNVPMSWLEEQDARLAARAA